LTGLGLTEAVFGQVAADASLVPARLARPALDTDEGGLWAMMDREETRLRRSSFVVRDEKLNNYLRTLICKLGGEHCADVRIHVVRTPQFNATMAPNGMMQVWSGLLLRVENEAQLAAVLGHELGHYLERHLLERMRDVKSKSAAATFLAMFGLVGALASLGVAASMFAFNREQEQRADRIGMRLMQRAGYDGAQAAQVWDNLLGELKITGGEEAGKRSAMFATHPPAANRRDELLALAGTAGGSLGDGEFERVVAVHRLDWLQEEIRRGQFEESLVLFDRMLRKSPDDAQVLFARGEIRRLRDQPEDLQPAIDDLARASVAEQGPLESHRSLGLAHKRRADAPAAVAAFEKYLTLAPTAGDAGLIKTYISELKP
jgi:predicted Zn-dependent protease